MTYFKFEADFVDSLRCIPMIVRLKLDTCGVKLKLAEWNRFTPLECQQLVDLPCDRDAEIATYRDYVSQLIFQHTGHEASRLAIDPQPPWSNDREVPESVTTRAAEEGVTIELSHWANLTTIQRFALIKLTRSQHENNNFLPALKEFKLLT
ncbi:nitrate reductase associated protein [Chamaesiphon sp. VAR_69_metabat_338]|uniref:nitrate reductase associated protein n=1 Tax=Chamaesiphon sp. VAR_69_metabat_338 TaxID=2964704 RepID=UPI00286D7C8C|nr:nitrate reductase associated protein [Chamaesiphon sp. VAR_69_metabat_338]